MVQYLFHGPKPREVKHMDVYLQQYVDVIDVKVSPNAVGVEAAKNGHEAVGTQTEEARKLRESSNGTLFTLSTDEALTMATQLLMAIGQIKQKLEEVA